jgi:thymidine phosphorylase
MAMAQLARNHGAGRFELDDPIDPHVGFVIEATKGTKIAKNGPLFTFNHNRPLEESELVSLKAMCTVGESEPEQAHRLLEVIDFASTKA